MAEKRLDGVFEGGGVKGIALIGAAEAVQAAGYEFVNLAGTSAGAIVAALLAAGYTAAELKPILMDLDFSKFEDTTLLGHLPIIGQYYEILTRKGIYKGDFFLNFLREKLTAKLGKDRVTFRDLVIPGETEDRYRFKAHVVASDISRGRMLVLPEDIQAYGIEPGDLEVALAVRMSMSIPYFFQPVRLTYQGQTCYIVDGGLLSNFPIELFDAPGVPAWPTFGFALVPPHSDSVFGSGVQYKIIGPLTELWAMFNTTMEARDAYYASQPDVAARTIKIDALGISATNFHLTNAQKQALYQSGQDCARAFLATWNFDDYIARFRGGNRPVVHRQAALARPDAPQPAMPD
ncbi:MAG: patatin-like phospholipase family protein [Isosphaeraceae bacterium]|nr:patatin-like phospholipase family protein [Isosphaeraceae bacterium]